MRDKDRSVSDQRHQNVLFFSHTPQGLPSEHTRCVGRDGTSRFIGSTASAPTSPGTVKKSDNMSDGGGGGGGGSAAAAAGTAADSSDSAAGTPDTPGSDKKEIRWHPDVVEKAVNEGRSSSTPGENYLLMQFDKFLIDLRFYQKGGKIGVEN